VTSRPLTQWLTAPDGTSLGGVFKATIARHGRWAAWLVPAIYVGCVIAFIADLTSSNTLAFGVFYAPLVATAVFHRDKRSVWVLTVIACAMNLIGAFFPTLDKDLFELAGNRVLSTLALLAIAAFTWHARMIQEKIAQQTERAEAAERIKTQVLTNLSQEIRGPLHSMIGVLDLVAADSRSEQKTALGMVRGAGRRLAMTIDNLVDLTQIEGKPLPADLVDLGMLLRQTAESKQSDATARQISLAINIGSDGNAMAHANHWAVRRILENKIDDAITYTAPGGHIDVFTETGEHECCAVISATGNWPPGAFLSSADLPSALLTPSVMGLALSHRLARAMNARLVFSNRPGEGTIVRLRLPILARPDVQPA